MLGGWDCNSSVASLHQISNFVQTSKMADFAAYDAQFYGKRGAAAEDESKKAGGGGGGGGGAAAAHQAAGAGGLRADLQGIGDVLSKELAKGRKK